MSFHSAAMKSHISHMKSPCQRGGAVHELAPPCAARGWQPRHAQGPDRWPGARRVRRSWHGERRCHSASAHCHNQHGAAGVAARARLHIDLLFAGSVLDNRRAARKLLAKLLGRIIKLDAKQLQPVNGRDALPLVSCGPLYQYLAGGVSVGGRQYTQSVLCAPASLPTPSCHCSSSSAPPLPAPLLLRQPPLPALRRRRHRAAQREVRDGRRMAQPPRTAASPTASAASCFSTATAALGWGTSVLYSQNSAGRPQSVQ